MNQINDKEEMNHYMDSVGFITTHSLYTTRGNT